MKIAGPALVVLVGVSASGKSHWAAANFSPGQIVSSDALRAVVGNHERDVSASDDAFAALDVIVNARLRRGLTTVIDTLGFDDERRAAWLAAARKKKMTTVAAVVTAPRKHCRDRNRLREHSVPVKVLDAQFARFAEVRDGLRDFDEVLEVDGAGAPVSEPAVRVVPKQFAVAAEQLDPRPTRGLNFGLQIPRFTWSGGTDEIADRLGVIVQTAEEVGFTSIWLMDHFLQIPQVGREWENMLESYTTLGFIAGITTRVRLGTLVTGITYRNIAHLAKVVATLDVVSAGRAICGLGAGWFEREHVAYGYEFGTWDDRYARLEDALEALPLMWGKGSPAFDGRRISIPESICYPRPVQDPIPILVGGSGERRTLALVAKYADACNLFGDIGTFRHKNDVLDRHCVGVGRDPGQILRTNLQTVLVGGDRPDLAARVKRHCPNNQSEEMYAAASNAGTIEDHIVRFSEFRDAGLQTAIVNMPDVEDEDSVERFAPVVEAFA